ncbi:hypothetical protein CALVIDRAFT_469168, partial [Calocera viscosa TUFC12733]
MHWHLRVSQSETSDTDLRLLVDSEHARYMINCGEGTTRNANQRREKYRNLKAVFLTRVDTDTASGLPGFILTQADTASPSPNNPVCTFDLLGPPPLLHFLTTTRRYCMRPNVNMRLRELETTSTMTGAGAAEPPLRPVFKDELLAVYAATSDDAAPAEFLPPPSSPGNTSEVAPAGTGAAPADGRAASQPAPDTRSSEEIIRSWAYPGFKPSTLTGRAAQLWRKLTFASQFPASDDLYDPASASDVPLPHLENKEVLQRLARNPYDLPAPDPPRAPYATSYFFLGKQFRGKFDAATADALGVPKGRIRGLLANGQSITLENGTLVTPEMCLGKSVAPSAFIVVDCPNADYLENLLRAPAMQPGAVSEDALVYTIVHRVGKDVLHDPRYVEWMHKWGAECHHLIANKELCPNDISMVSCAYFQLRMSTISAETFRVPQYTLVPSVPLSTFANLPANTQPLLAGQEIQLHPRSPPVIVNKHKDLFHKALEGEQTVDPPRVAHKVNSRLARDARQSAPSRPGDDVRFIALGTASAIPSKYRNVSSMIVQYPGPIGPGIMLDVGEATWGQMTRHFGVLPGIPNAYSALRNLRLLFLSHIHGDHHMGAARLLVQRRKLDPPPEPLYIIANWVLAGYLREYSAGIEDLGWGNPAYVRLIDTDCVTDPRFDGPSRNTSIYEAKRSKAALAEVAQIFDMESIIATEVLHRSRCHALVCRRKDGFSFAYSADTMPCETFVEAGRGVRVLIHEATFADDEEVNAVRKTHSTAKQAVTIGRQMGAEHTLLTHFSQRYPKMP